MRQGFSAGMRGALVPFCILLCSAAAPVDWSHAKRVEDVASDYKFTPNHLVFQRGVAYRLHLVNRGQEMHEFHSQAFFAAIDMRNPQILNSDRDEIDLPPGDQKVLYFVARQAGRFKLYCPDHDWAGMTGEIEIR